MAIKFVKTILENTGADYKEGNPAFDTADSFYLESASDAAFRKDAGRSMNCYATDYAIATGCNTAAQGDHTIEALTRTLSKNRKSMSTMKEQGVLTIKMFQDFSDWCSLVDYDNIHSGSYPCCAVDLKSLNSSDYRVVRDKKNYIYIEFPTMKYPQNKVNSDLADKLEDSLYFAGKLSTAKKIKKTGRTYCGFYSKSQKPMPFNEYEYNGKLYVRVIPCEGYGVYDDDTKTIDYHQDVVWIEVAPVKWEILNWEEMPKRINPSGSGEAKTMQLKSEKALFTLPFSRETIKINSTNMLTKRIQNISSLLWQNSEIRAYLNGYNIFQEINKGNGNSNFKANLNYIYKGKGFLDEMDHSALLTAQKSQNTVDDEDEDENIDLPNETDEPAEIDDSNNQGQSEFDEPNPYGFVYDELDNDDLLKMYVQSGVSVFLHGPSGIGKSGRVLQLDPTYTKIALRNNMNPEEVDGVLDRESKTGEYNPPFWYTDLCKKCEAEPDRRHVLFIDELTNVKPGVQSLVYSIVLDRAGKDGLWPLPKNAVVVAAGNEAKDYSAAYPLTGALFRRFNHVYFDVNVGKWLKWATEVSKTKNENGEARIHPAIVAFVQSRGEDVLYKEYDEENPQIAVDPRKWEIASHMLYATNNPKVLTSAIGEDLTADFVDFVQNTHITLKNVLEGKYSKNDFAYMQIDEKLSTIVGLVSCTEDQLPTVRKFISKYLGKEMLSTFDSLWIKNDPARAQIIAESYTKFIKEGGVENIIQ